MRVIHIVHGKVNPKGPNGISRVVYFMNKYQKIQGHNSEVWAFVDEVEKHETFERDEFVKVEMFPRLNFFSLKHPMIELFKQERGSIDIVHFHMIWFLDKNILSKSLKKLGIPFVATTHGTYSVPLSYKGKKNIARYMYELRFLNRANAIHALTPEEKNGLYKYGVRNEMFVIPNGIEKSEIPGKLNSNYFDEYSSDSKVKFAWVGVLRKDKNLDTLVKSFSYLPREIKDKIHLFVIGPDYKNTKKKLKILASKVGCEKNISFTGPLFGKDKFDALKSVDVYIMPSSSEGVSLSILDAMALGKPCILTRGCNMTYYYDRGFFEMCESIPDEIAKAIVRIFRKKNKWKQMGQAAKKLTNNVFEWDKISRELIANYKKIIRDAN